MIANSASAMKPSAATRSASCGVIGGRRSSGGEVTAASCLVQRRQAAGRVGAAAAAARVLGQAGEQPAAHERVDRASRAARRG